MTIPSGDKSKISNFFLCKNSGLTGGEGVIVFEKDVKVMGFSFSFSFSLAGCWMIALVWYII